MDSVPAVGSSSLTIFQAACDTSVPYGQQNVSEAVQVGGRLGLSPDLARVPWEPVICLFCPQGLILVGALPDHRCDVLALD
jgi:hypothetical protein